MGYTLTTTPDTLTARHHVLADPMNVRVAGRAIYDAIKAEQGLLDDGQILAVVIGEDHARPMQVLTQDYLLHRLKADAASDFVLGCELPCNTLSLLAQTILETPTEQRKTIADSIQAMDHDGHLALSASMAFNPSDYAPVARSLLMSSASELGVTTVFADAAMAARSGKFYVAASDVFAGALYGTISKPIPYNSVDGHVVRNTGMAFRAFKAAKQQGARIILMPCGLNHAYGNATEGHAFETSMIEAFNSLGCRTLGVSFPYPDGHTAPVSVLKRRPQDVVIGNMSNDYFYYKNDPDRTSETAYVTKAAGPYDYAARLKELKATLPAPEAIRAELGRLAQAACRL
ncbi:MAG: hypothetical protein KGQ41_07825 [Alphaproteobacteria bacterium]|nr:hypothetical protein [Alphaproteobacteria bacterium]